MWRILTSVFFQNLLARAGKNETVLGLIVICKKKGTIKYSNKLTNVVKLLNCVSLKSKIELLCLFAIQDEVYWREKFKHERKLFETEKASKIWHVNKFSIIFTTPGFSQPI